MNITKIEFCDTDMGHDFMGNPDGNYTASFVLSADGKDYTGRALFDIEEGVGVEWDTDIPHNDAHAEDIVAEAFRQSVGIAVRCDPVNLAQVLAEIDLVRAEAATDERASDEDDDAEA